MDRRLTILLLIVGSFAQDSTFVLQINDKNDVLYFKDGKYLECEQPLSLVKGVSFMEYDGEVFNTFFDVKCNNQIFDVELVDKIVYAGGVIKTGKELVAEKKKRNFGIYSIIASLMVLLVIITT